MNAQEKIDRDNNWKEITKKIVEDNTNYSDYEKEHIKFLLDLYHEHNKSVIIKNVQQSQLSARLLKENLK